MTRVKSKTKYPNDWDSIAEKAKKRFNYCCERCGHKHDPKAGYCLTVHHLDGDKSNNEDWNLAVTCQRCHLYLQGTVIMSQMLFEFVEVSAWFRWHLEGYQRSQNDRQR